MEATSGVTCEIEAPHDWREGAGGIATSVCLNCGAWADADGNITSPEKVAAIRAANRLSEED